MNKIQKLLALLIILLTISLRFIGISKAPPQLGNDEVSIAWDAYSLLHTLRDEHNNFLPLSFESHGTYKAPMAIYLAVVPTWIFGNNDFSPRLPSMILGTLTVVLVGLVAYELTRNASLSLISSLMLAISPAHIIASRAAQETNIALFFVVLGVYLFYRSLRNKNIIYILGACLSFAASVYSYHTEWIFTPLLIATLGLVNFKQCFKKPIYYVSAIVFVLLVLPIFWNSISSAGPNARQNTELITHAPNVKDALNDPAFPTWQKAQVVFKAVIGSYSSYVSPQYLFFDGYKLLSERDPYTIGLFLSPFAICFAVGLFINKSRFLLLWALLGPIVPAITLGDHNNYRNLVTIAPYAIIIAIGLVEICGLCKRIRFGQLIPLGAITISCFYFLVIYFYHLPYESGESYQAGYKEVAEFIGTHYEKYQRIIVDPRFGDFNKYDGVPHLYLPYYTYINPNKMLTRVANKNGLFVDKYEFRAVNWGLEKVEEGNLYIVPASNPPDLNSKLLTLQEIKLPSGKIEFKILSVK